MKLSEVKEIYAMIEEQMVYPNWTTKQNVNDFIEFIEGDKEIQAIWNRSNREAFPYCLDELYLEYIKYEGFVEEEEEERDEEILIRYELTETKMLIAEYQKSVAL